MIGRGVNRIKKSILSLRLERLARQLQFNPESNLYLFSDPRGGSTWLAQTLLRIPKTAIINEPLHLGYISDFKKIGFGWRQHIPENAEWPEAKQAFDKVFSGNVLTSDIINLSQPDDYKNAEQLLVKFCRGNALLPWLVKNYTLDFKPILLLRHPIAVAASQLKQGGWNFDFTQFEIPNNPYNEIYLSHSDFLRSVKTKEAALVAHWCIVNSVALKSPLSHKWMTIHYENLFLEPEKEIRKVFADWNKPLPQEVLSQLHKTSDSAKREIDFSNRMNQLNKWRSDFNEIQLAEMIRVMQYFGIEIYNDSPLPHFA